MGDLICRVIVETPVKLSKEQKELLEAELKGFISQRFDIIVKKKQLRYEKLQKKLEYLKKEVAENQTELATLKNQKESEVDKRV